MMHRISLSMKRQSPSMEVTDMHSSSNKRRMIHSKYFEYTGLSKSSTPAEANYKNFKSVSDFESEEGRLHGKELSFKIDRCKKFQCIMNLKKLMEHSNEMDFSIGFESGPIVLKSNSMEIIKSKLENDMYYGTDEFATDVRLSFSNAIHNYPPKHKMHRTAKQLQEIFEKNWKSLKEHWKNEKLEDEEEYSRIKIRMKPSRKIKQSLTKGPFLSMTSKEEEYSYEEEGCDNFSAPSSLYKDLQRKKDREAARIVIKNMKRTVYMDESRKALKELELMCGQSLSQGNPLQNLGLVLKNDNMAFWH